MNEYKILSLDESGKASYSHASKLFILSGVIIPEEFKPKLDNKIKKLKIKFFKKGDIVFHSRDMYRRKGPFSILRDPKIELSFWSEFVSILNHEDIVFVFVITQKEKAKKLNWQPKTILKRSYLKILQRFFQNLKKSNNKGKVVIESEPSQDPYLIEAHNLMQSLYSDYKTRVTSLSLVSKLNMDSDVQIADALASVAGMLFLSRNQGKAKNRKVDNIEKMKERLITRKLVVKLNPSFLEKLV